MRWAWGQAVGMPDWSMKAPSGKAPSQFSPESFGFALTPPLYKRTCPCQTGKAEYRRWHTIPTNPSLDNAKRYHLARTHGSRLDACRLVTNLS